MKQGVGCLRRQGRSATAPHATDGCGVVVAQALPAPMGMPIPGGAVSAYVLSCMALTVG